MQNELRKWFEKTGTTVSSFAKLIEVDRAAVYYWLAGKRYPTLKNALVIHRVTGIDLDDLLEKTNDN